MSVVAVYRATDPAIMASVEAWKAQWAEWKRSVMKFATTHSESSAPVVNTYADGARHLVGLSYEPDLSIPDGWRVTDRGGMTYSVPNRRSKAGKALGAEMDSLALRAFHPDGMPSAVFVENHWFSPGVEELSGTIYLTWALVLEECSDDEQGFSKQSYDPSRWERVKLSEYHAMKEAKEEKGHES